MDFPFHFLIQQRLILDCETNYTCEIMKNLQVFSPFITFSSGREREEGNQVNKVRLANRMRMKGNGDFFFISWKKM